MSAMEGIENKNVLLIGGGSGMGQASALALAERGAKVAIAGRRMEMLKETSNKFGNGNEILCKDADLTDRESLEDLFQWFDQYMGKQEFLIHGAGNNEAKRSMQELDPKDWDRLIDINLTGSYNVLRLTLERMRAQKK